MSPSPLELVIARLSLGLVLREELPAIASEAIEAGHDSSSLRLLAGLTPAEIDDAWRLLENALRELGVAPPPKRAAIPIVAGDIARRIVAGEIDPYRGAKEIWRLTLMQDGDRLAELDPFIYAASEWEERPEDRGFFERAIVEQARDLTESM